MRRVLCLSLLLATGLACDDFGAVQREDTIPAYEAYLADHTTGPNVFRAQVRLEELYLAKARDSGKLEDWDAYLERFPKGQHTDAAIAEREASLFAWAEWEATPEAWKTFLDEYPKPRDKRGTPARDGLEATTYAPHLSNGPMDIHDVNLAEDPTGPMNGKAFVVDVTNEGDKTIVQLWYRIHYLDADGHSLGYREWPVVAPLRNFPVPVEDDKTVPMKPGETRRWEWWTGDLPERFAGKARVIPIRIRFAE
ncbi:MAG: hypothetical protein KC656_31135, partial [Myxococcales bacterium]|nr:hypothetical protein [Myxococcales bacterium]